MVQQLQVSMLSMALMYETCECLQCLLKYISLHVDLISMYFYGLATSILWAM